MTRELIKTEIKGRDIVFYLTSKNDLEAIKSKNIFADIFLALFSLAAGALISIFLTKELSSELSVDILNRLSPINTILTIVSLSFLAFYIIFTLQSYRAINNIISSGRVTSFNMGTNNDVEDYNSTTTTDGQLKIIEAFYYTNNKKFDVTKVLQNSVTNNRLETTAGNNLVGDPDPGTPKKLRIKYRYDNVEYAKVYNEGDPVILP